MPHKLTFIKTRGTLVDLCYSFKQTDQYFRDPSQPRLDKTYTVNVSGHDGKLLPELINS